MRDSLSRFVQGAWHVVEPSTPLVWSWHLDVLCNHVQALFEDAPGTPQNLAISIPPGSCKSLVVSVFLPAWMWLKRPSWRALYASGAPTVVTRDSMRCRTVVKSDWYTKTFTPEWKISSTQDEKQYYENTAGGWRKGVAAGAGITGERADALVIDDPNSASEIHSAAHRRGINENWYEAAFQSRIADPAKSKRCLIQQRLHAEDLTGFLLTREKGQWSHLVMQMEYDAKGPGDRPTWLGWSDPRKSEGELLMPSRFTPAFLAAQRLALGSYNYSGQMQQLPSPAQGGRFKREWWRFWSPTGQMQARPQGCSQVPPIRFNPAVDRYDELIGSWDLSFKGGDHNDYVAGVTVYRVGAKRFVVALYHEHAGFRQAQDAILQQSQDWPRIEAVLVEEAANGAAVVETLASVIPCLIPVKPLGGKEARAAIMEPRVEAGSWYLPEGAEWLGEWIEEFASFPLGKHDDIVDSAGHAEARFLEDSEVASARALLGGLR